MKRILICTISIVIVAAFILFSCKKEHLDLKDITDKEFSFDFNSQIPYSCICVEEKGFTGKSGSSTILAFSDMDAFLLTLRELERQMLDYDSAFLAFFSNLDEEALNAKEKEIGFINERPLLNFTDFFEYHSLFNKINEEEKIWLENEELDLQNDPDDHFIFEEELRTLLNVDCEVKIGSIIYKFTEEGYFEMDDDFKLLMLVDMGIETNDVSFIGNTGIKSDCAGFKTSSGYKPSGDKKIKWKVAIITYPWERFVKAKTKNFKKEKFLWTTRWSKYRTACSARVYGHISGAEGDCSTKVQFNTATSPYYAYESNAKKAVHKVWVSTKTKSGWVKGSHYGAGGIQYSSTLTW